jgi:ribosomal-protein-alanine N-acetyltransferase
MPTAGDVPAILAYYEANRDHLGPVEPRRPAEFYTPPYWRTAVKDAQREFRRDDALRLFVFPREAEPDAVLGSINFTGIVRGTFQACRLGYSLGHDAQGKGYMTEALRASIHFVFNKMNMHRITAAYLPENARSGQVLSRIGFVPEGIAKSYLLIDGHWRDHVVTSLVNPLWRA